jgi:hypothetical protein
MTLQDSRRLADQVQDLTDVLGDMRKLVRQLDVAMSGEEGAAKQASLCDLIEQGREMRRLLSGFDVFGPKGNFHSQITDSRDENGMKDNDDIQILVSVGLLRRVRAFFKASE